MDSSLLTNDVAKLAVGQGQYTLMLNEEAGVIDDLIIYHLTERAIFPRRECLDDR